MHRSRFIEYDHIRHKHLCRIGGPGDPVVETDTLELMLDFLDRLDAVEAADQEGTQLHVTLRGSLNHVSSTLSSGVGSTRRGDDLDFPGYRNSDRFHQG